ncbi:MAG: nitroreductase family protein [Terrisporobacter sp.]
MDYKKLISNGKSVREFKNDSIEEKYFTEIETHITNAKRLLPKINIEVKIYDKKDCYEKLKNIAGYNGYMIEAPNYVLILSDVSNGYIENSGYIGERLILKGRDLGIDSCWITFKDSHAIKEKLDISSEKEVTAIIALGYEDNKNTKNKSGSERLSVEEIVYMNEWGKNANVAELEERGLLDAFNYARMAPSALNRQPWRFIIDGGNIILAVRKDDFNNNYEGSIDTGIAMLYFSLIIDTTMFDLQWNLDNINKDYKIPNDYEIVGYCGI